MGHRHPLMLHSAGIHSAAHGAGTLRIATVMEWQRARPAEGERVLWWTLNDASRAVDPTDTTREMIHQEHFFNCMVQADGSFAPALDGRDPASEADHEVQLIHHHDAAEYLGPAVPRPDDMWQNWLFDPRDDTPPEIVVEEPWWERHNLRPPQTVFKLKDVATLGKDGVWRLDAQTKRPVPDRIPTPSESVAV